VPSARGRRNKDEIKYLEAQVMKAALEGQPVIVPLDDLFNAQDRLARSEGLYATAWSPTTRLRQSE